MDNYASWRQLDGEPEQWYKRFYDYARVLGYEFTPVKAFSLYSANMHTKGLTIFPEDAKTILAWVEAANEWHWADRAKTWSDEDRLAVAIKWRKRREDLLEDDWETGSALRKVTLRALEDIDSFVVAEEDKETNRLEVRLTVPLSHIAQAARAGSELQRLGVGEPTAIVASMAPRVYLPAVDPPSKGDSNVPDENQDPSSRSGQAPSSSDTAPSGNDHP